MSSFRAKRDLLDRVRRAPLRCVEATPMAGTPIVMGWGACSECKCTGYVSDSARDGHCICGHTAASHA